MTQYIKAPFNFVPLNEKVFFPEWADQVSHDIPFEDGESGTIELEMTAMTPIFIRNGHTRKDAELKEKSDAYTSFSKDADGNYFIPATSVKGMIRNVMEIISFGKMKVDDRMKFAQREWNDTKVYPLKSPNVQTNIRCGWLEISENSSSKIIDCGLPLRINHLRLDEYLQKKGINVSFEKYFSRSSKFDLNKEQTLDGLKYDPKDAAFKYALIGKNTQLLEKIKFNRDTEYYCTINGREMSPPAFCERREKVVSGSGEITGTIVLTGQPDLWVDPRMQKRGMSAGKFYEFIFQEQESEKSYFIGKKEIDHFKFIYQESQAWQYFKLKKRIPIFFRSTSNGIKDFGLALLYKLPYDFSVEEIAIRSQSLQNETRNDLAEAILGFTEKDNSLKSRVQFCPGFAVDNPVPLKEVKSTLGSPKASYCPIYVEQSGSNGVANPLLTYNDPKAKLSGWKRYPVKNIATPRQTDNPQLDSPFCPLPERTKFKCKIRFYNLRKVELGALLSAITFHNNNHQLFHNIGMGKPMGYGKLKLDAKLVIDGKNEIVTKFLCLFEEIMDNFCKENYKCEWLKTDQITELFTMAFDRDNAQNDLLLEYMIMDPKGKNEFIEAKKLNEYLQRFSVIAKQKFLFNSPCKQINLQRKELERLQNEADAKQLAAEKLEAERLKLELEEKARMERLAQKVEGGLSFLTIAKNFDDAKRRIDDWMKKAKLEILPENQHQFLLDAITRFFAELKPKEKSKWAEPLANNPIWKKIAGWVGAELAGSWYKQILQKE